MTESFKKLTQSVGQYVQELSKEIPDVIKGFGALQQGANQENTLSSKNKELIALCIGVATHCDACIGFHSEKLVKYQASRKEVAEALGIAIYMGGGPSLMYAAKALQAFDEFSK